MHRNTALISCLQIVDCIVGKGAKEEGCFYYDECLFHFAEVSELVNILVPYPRIIWLDIASELVEEESSLVIPCIF